MLGKQIGIPVFILDMVKGWLPVMMTRWMVDARGIPSDWPAIAAGVGTVLGHNFTIRVERSGFETFVIGLLRTEPGVR